VNAPTGEVLLRVGLDENGHAHLHFRLYDSSGSVAAESGGPKSFPDGLKIDSVDGELLLDVSPDLDADIQYRLYNQDGRLLTCSDGVTTKILPLLRMEVGGGQRSGATTKGAAGRARLAPKTQGSSTDSSS
jgi:hypothetical protein